MESVLLLLLQILATYRLALLITTEEGPFELAARFRNLFLSDNWLGRGVRCFYCVSFWVALFVTGLAYFGVSQPITLRLLMWWGVAGGAIIVDRYWKR